MMQVMALEGYQDNPIVVPNSPPIPIPAPGGNLLVEIMDRTDNDMAQAITEDRAEAGVRRVTVRKGRVFRIIREIYEEGEDIIDMLQRVEAQDILRLPVITI